MATKLAAHEEALGHVKNIWFGRATKYYAGWCGWRRKSTVVSAFAEMLIDGQGVPRSLLYQQVLLDASSLISVAAGRGELENLVTMILNEAFLSKNVILCLDNAQLFFEEGVGSVDLSNVLLPILEAGNLRMILTMDDQRFLQISQMKPQLAHALNTHCHPTINRSRDYEDYA